MLDDVRRARVRRSSIRPSRLLLGFGLLLAFGMKYSERRTAVRILRRTMAHAPFMFEKIASLIAIQYMEVRRLASTVQALRAQIDHDAALSRWPRRESAGWSIPAGFRLVYPRIFADLHERVSRDLRDKTQLEEVLVEVVSDFLLRWGATFHFFEDFHRMYLEELCDRSIRRATESEPNVRAGEDRVVTKPRQYWVYRLGNDVLRSAEQRLRAGTIRPAGSGTENADLK